jgi:hypothetical protein
MFHKLNKDCLFEIIHWTQNDACHISLSATCTRVLKQFQNYYQKLPIEHCLIKYQYCSFVPTTFTPDILLIYDIIQNNKKISFEWILYNREMSSSIYNRISHKVRISIDFIIIFMNYLFTKNLSSSLHVACFIKLVRIVFENDSVDLIPNISKFTFGKPKYYNRVRQEVIAVCQIDRSLYPSKIQTYFDYVGQTIDYYALGLMCWRNRPLTHIFYTYSETDCLTFGIFKTRNVQDYNDRYPTDILRDLPIDCAHTTAIYNSFIKILDLTFSGKH